MLGERRNWDQGENSYKYVTACYGEILEGWLVLLLEELLKWENLLNVLLK